jgi:hypothetical protein
LGIGVSYMLSMSQAFYIRSIAKKGNGYILWVIPAFQKGGSRATGYQVFCIFGGRGYKSVVKQTLCNYTPNLLWNKPEINVKTINYNNLLSVCCCHLGKCPLEGSQPNQCCQSCATDGSSMHIAVMITALCC